MPVRRVYRGRVVKRTHLLDEKDGKRVLVIYEGAVKGAKGEQEVVPLHEYEDRVVKTFIRRN